MQSVAAALGHSIDDRSRSPPIFRGVVRRVDLKFLYRSFRAGIADPGPPAFFGEKCLIVVSAIDGVVVQQRADTAKTQQPKSAGIIDHPRRKKSKVRPASSINWQIVDRRLIHNGSELRRIGVYLCSFRRYLNHRAGRFYIQSRQKFRDAANVDNNFLGFVIGEPGSFDRNGVCSRLQLACSEISRVIGCQR